jgi:hypothetical protein
MITLDILKKARQAKPPAAERGIYGPLMPVIRQLLNNGFDLRQAVAWCVAEGLIAEEKYRSAYYAISNRVARLSLQAAKP